VNNSIYLLENDTNMAKAKFWCNSKTVRSLKILCISAALSISAPGETFPLRSRRMRVFLWQKKEKKRFSLALLKILAAPGERKLRQHLHN